MSLSIVHEAPGFLKVFSDGSVKRFSPGFVFHSDDEPSNGSYKFKDVTIDPLKPITARIFLPEPPPENHLPVIVYFHGGGFCIGSTTWTGYHHFLGDLCATSKSVILSIDYRLAPENKLPVAYEDCYSSIEWLIEMKKKNSDPWLRKADLGRVFLSGDSAGANIAQQVTVKMLEKKTTHVGIAGVLLIHPFFGSQKRTEKEMGDGCEGHVASNDMFWGLSLPVGEGRDYYGCNFETADLSTEVWRRFPAVAVHVAELDFLKERGVMYAEFLKEKEVREVELVEAEGEGHVYNLYDPGSESTRLLQKHMADFVSRV